MFAAETWDQRYSEEVNLVLQQAGPLCTHGFIHKSKMQITQTRKDFLPLWLKIVDPVYSSNYFYEPNDLP